MATLTGFHEGELAVQAKAGVSSQAARLSGMLAPPSLDGGGARILSMLTFAAITARDGEGTLWTSALTGTPGFLKGQGTTLQVEGLPRPGDPLAELPVGQQVGLIAIEFARRRRIRVNGTLSAAGPNGLTIDVEQAYGNCPQYINERMIEPSQDDSTDATRTYDDTVLNTQQAGIITAANTFFLGTAHPTRGADSSHKGGPKGFVRVEDGEVWWPDFPGNNMFNSFGNIAVNPTASLLFVDFTEGMTLHLSGNATIEWTTPGVPGDDGHTGRRVRFTPKRVVQPSTPAF